MTASFCVVAFAGVERFSINEFSILILLIETPFWLLPAATPEMCEKWEYNNEDLFTGTYNFPVEPADTRLPYEYAFIFPIDDVIGKILLFKNLLYIYSECVKKRLGKNLLTATFFCGITQL